MLLQSPNGTKIPKSTKIDLLYRDTRNSTNLSLDFTISKELFRYKRIEKRRRCFAARTRFTPKITI